MSSSLFQQRQQMVQRITAERKRIEQLRTHPPMTVLRPGATALSAGGERMVEHRPRDGERGGAVLTEADFLEPPAGWRMGAPGMARSRAVPEIDLERLTEQIVHKIDERIIAHRERLGKIY
jgi:hypothetical protein